MAEARTTLLNCTSVFSVVYLLNDTAADAADCANHRLCYNTFIKYGAWSTLYG